MEWHEKVFWQAATGVLVLLVGAPTWIGRGVAAPRPAEVGLCPTGTYVVKGRSLIRSGMRKGEDTVVLNLPGETEGALPALVVRSGCPEAPVTLEATKGGMRLSARLSGCTGVEGEIALRAKVDRTCTTMRGKLGAGPAGKSLVRGGRFTAALNGGGVRGGVGEMAPPHGGASLFLPDMRVFLVRRGGKRIQHPIAKSGTSGSFSISGRATGE